MLSIFSNEVNYRLLQQVVGLSIYFKLPKNAKNKTKSLVNNGQTINMHKGIKERHYKHDFLEIIS